jgi:branched-chain amino acid transport system substrate-binding protein
MIVPVAFDDGEDVTRQFVASYRQRVGAAPDVTAAMAYDATQVALAALAAATDPLDPASVGEAMHGVAGVASLSGPLAIDRQGRARRPLAVRELAGGTDAYSTRVIP